MFSTMSPMRIARVTPSDVPRRARVLVVSRYSTYVRAFLIPERRGSVVALVGDDGRTAGGTAACCLSACLRATHSFLC